MEIKCLEVRDVATFTPVICIRPVPDNDAQRYLLRRDMPGEFRTTGYRSADRKKVRP